MSEMERVAEHSFSLNTSVMKIIGLYPVRTNKFLHKVYFSAIYYLGMFPITILSILHFVYTEELTNFNYNDFMMVAMVFYTLKFLQFARNRDKVRNCIHYFDDPFFSVVKNEHKKIVMDCVRICRRNSKIFFIGCLVGYSGLVGQAFLNLHRLPLDVWMPKWVENEPIYFYTEFFLVLLGVGYSALACGVVDPLIGGLAYQATAQLKILKDNLRHVDFEGNEQSPIIKNTKERNKYRKMYSQIKKCVHHHQTILDFVSEYQLCISSALFSQFTGGGLVIALLCFQISKMLTVDFSFAMALNYLGCLFFQIFFYCYYGTLLIEESKTMSDAIYLSRWYEYDIRSKKALITLMEQSKKPMIVTAGKLFDLSLETFTLTFERAYSLLAVLKNY